MKFSQRSRAGQVMILTVLALGGTVLGATTIAGLLMSYQLRQVNDLANSARAIFAADAGMELAFYNMFCAYDPAKNISCPIADLPVFTNGASLELICSNEAGEPVANCEGDSVRLIRSVGRSRNAHRAFEAAF